MNLRFSFGLVILILVAAIPVFAYLGYMPIQLWDEGRQAIGALEMSNTHNWLINCYDGRPDMWSTKPPLLISLQALSINLFGMSEWAVRFPSAAAAICTCFILYWFCSYKLKRTWLGIISVLILVTSQGYIMIHGTRTADYDPLLTLFTTAFCIYYFLFLQTNKPQYLYGTFLLLTLAVLTKGVAGLLFIPGLFLYTLYSKQVLMLLKQQHFYAGLLIFLFFVIGFYLLREHYNPGYIKAVMENELGGRYNKTQDNNRGIFLFYYNCLRKYQFNYWYLLLIPGALAGLSIKELRSFTIYSLLLTTTFFFIISAAQTKLYWYAMPLYPFLSIIVGAFIYVVCKFIADSGATFFKRFNPIPYVFLLIVFYFPYRDTVRYISGLPVLPERLRENEQMVLFLQAVLHNNRQVGPCMVSWNDYQPNVLWYIKVINNKKHLFKFVPNNEFNATGEALAYKLDTKKYIEAHYNAQIVKNYNGVILYQLNGTR